MRNVVSVVVACMSLCAALWGFGVGPRLSVGVGAAALTAACVLLLVDVEELL